MQVFSCNLRYFAIFATDMRNKWIKCNDDYTVLQVATMPLSASRLECAWENRSLGNRSLGNPMSTAATRQTDWYIS